MRHSNILLWLFVFISNCQYFSAESNKYVVTTTITDIKYQQHIKIINACLESAQEQPLSDPEKQAIDKQLEKETKQRDAAGTIKPAHYGSICANYSSGTIESERVRRCRYQLDIYPAVAISYCSKQARADTTRVKTNLVTRCQEFQAEAQQVSDTEIMARLARHPLYAKIKDSNCDDEG